MAPRFMTVIATSGAAAPVVAESSAAAAAISWATARLVGFVTDAAKPSATMRARGSRSGRPRSSAAHDAPSELRPRPTQSVKSAAEELFEA